MSGISPKHAANASRSHKPHQSLPGAVCLQLSHLFSKQGLFGGSFFDPFSVGSGCLVRYVVDYFYGSQLPHDLQIGPHDDSLRRNLEAIYIHADISDKSGIP